MRTSFPSDPHRRREIDVSFVFFLISNKFFRFLIFCCFFTFITRVPHDPCTVTRPFPSASRYTRHPSDGVYDSHRMDLGGRPSSVLVRYVIVVIAAGDGDQVAVTPASADDDLIGRTTATAIRTAWVWPVSRRARSFGRRPGRCRHRRR